MLLALLAVALLEASNAATGVKNLLLAGVERVALRAHVNEHVIFPLASGAGHEGCCRTSTSPQRGDNQDGYPAAFYVSYGFGGTRVVMPLWQDVNRNLRDCTRLSGREDALRRRRRRRKRVGPQGLEPWTGRL